MSRRVPLQIWGALILAAALLLAVQRPLRPREPDVNPFPFYVIIDEQTGKELTRLPHKVQLGDEWITSENRVYRVRRVQGNKALARFHRHIKLSDPPDVR